MHPYSREGIDPGITEFARSAHFGVGAFLLLSRAQEVAGRAGRRKTRRAPCVPATIASTSQAPLDIAAAGHARSDGSTRAARGHQRGARPAHASARNVACGQGWRWRGSSFAGRAQRVGCSIGWLDELNVQEDDGLVDRLVVRLVDCLFAWSVDKLIASLVDSLIRICIWIYGYGYTDT